MLLALAWTSWPRPLCAQEPAVSSEVDSRKVGVEDLVQWRLTLEGAALRLEEEVAVPPLKNVKVVGGPSVSTQISLVNAQMSQKKVYTWVLRPTATGTAEIGAVTVKHAGGLATAPAITLEVVAGSLHGRPGARPGGAPRDPFGSDPFEDMFGPRRGRSVEGKLFIEAVPAKSRVHVGEGVLVTYFIYARGVQPTDVQSAGTPQYPGFWAENLESQEGPKEEEVRVDGEPFVRVPIYRKLLFPTKAGTLSIPALTLRIALARQSLFDSGVVVERSTRPLKLTVEPLPDGPGFTGAVGRFKAQSTADPAALRLGDAATVRFKVEGVGNLKWIDKGPDLVVDGAKVFPPQVKSDLVTRADGIAGSRTWEYVVVPETTGSLVIPPLAFSYFDPSERRALRVETAPLTLEVQGGAQAAGGPAVTAPAPRGRSTLALRDALDPPRRAMGALPPRTLGLLLIVLAVAHSGFWALGRVPGWSRGSAARGSARSALKLLQRVSDAGLAKEEAAAFIEKALHEAFQGRDGDPGGARESTVAALLEEVHLVRFAPQLGDYSEKVRDLARRAREAVERWA